MKSRKFCLLCSAVVAGLVMVIPGAMRPVMADELLMKDGSRLMGKVVKKEGATLQFETTYAGVINVQWDAVGELRTDEPVKVMLDNDTTLQTGTIRKTGEEIMLETVAGAPAQSVPQGTVALINPEPWQLGEGAKVTGHLNIALKSERGNSEDDEFDADGELRLRRIDDRFTMYGQYENDRTAGVVTTEKWYLDNKYDYFVSEKLYYGAKLAFEHDKFADLDLRTRFGPHVGYQFFESTERNLDVDVGVLYVDDNYNVADDDQHWSLGWQVDFDWFLVPDRVQFYHRHTGYQDVNYSDNLTVDSWTGFRFPLYKGIVAVTEAELDYDGGAPDDVHKTDTTYRLKLGYQW